MTVVLNLSAELAGHVAVALRRHRQWAAAQSVRVPDGFANLESVMHSCATRGQVGTPLDDLWEVAQSRVVSPQLLTYEAASDVLSVSVRQVKRLVADRAIPSVPVGGAVRIRVTDLDAYVAGLPTKEAA